MRKPDPKVSLHYVAVRQSPLQCRRRLLAFLAGLIERRKRAKLRLSP
jgi:hypothetical protein